MSIHAAWRNGALMNISVYIRCAFFGFFEQWAKWKFSNIFFHCAFHFEAAVKRCMRTTEKRRRRKGIYMHYVWLCGLVTK